MSENNQTMPAEAVELEESQLEAAQGGVSISTLAQRAGDGSVNKIADGSVRPGVIKAGDGSV